jgi:diaminohydroxyphosphoribosylaminopyrimidine deaminase/5-amino-6-(5-phosphoribosylamino)uracil reductase
MVSDEIFMRRALSLAKVRKGLTHPNPTVGCVIVKDGKIVGEGFHKKAGEPHAEVVALKQAGEKARDAAVYVTLEPCSHYGRTPPCSLALIQAGVKRVVIATLDPNPRVAGRGVQMLKNAGIEVEVGLLEREAKELNLDFFHWITTKKPYVVLKIAQTLDGFIATTEGKSKWITSFESRKKVHRMRCESDAILVGVGTVLKDNPELTVRHVKCEKKPLRVILDTNLRIPLNAKVLDTLKAPTLIFTASEDREKLDALRDKGVEVVKIPAEGGLLNLEKVLEELGKREVVRLMVEGGAKVFGEFYKRKLFNEISVFVAPKVFGKGISPFEGFKNNTPSEESDLELVSVERFGGDVLLNYRRRGWDSNPRCP